MLKYGRFVFHADWHCSQRTLIPSYMSKADEFRQRDEIRYFKDSLHPSHHYVNDAVEICSATLKFLKCAVKSFSLESLSEPSAHHRKQVATRSKPPQGTVTPLSTNCNVCFCSRLFREEKQEKKRKQNPLSRDEVMVCSVANQTYVFTGQLKTLGTPYSCLIS